MRRLTVQTARPFHERHGSALVLAVMVQGVVAAGLLAEQGQDDYLVAQNGGHTSLAELQLGGQGESA